MQRTESAGVRVIIAAAFGASVLAAGAVTATHTPLRCRVLPLIAVAAGLLFGGACAAAVAGAWSSQYLGIPRNSIVRFTGTVLEDSRRLADGRSLVRMRADHAFGRDGSSSASEGEVLVTAPSGSSFSAGENLVLAATIVPFGFGADGASNLYAQLTKPQFTARVSAAGIHRAGWSGALAETRSSLLHATLAVAACAGGVSAPLLQALLTGNQDSLDAGVSGDFRRAGCAHILALSGMHLGILTALVSLLFSRLFGKRPAFLLGLIFVAFYIWLAGPRPSLLRAGLMFAVAGFALVRGRRVSGAAVLSICFCVQLAAVPQSGLSLSFQLSYLAIGGILFASPIVTRLAAPYVTPAGAALAGAGVGAHVAVLPLVAAVFGEVFPVGLVAGMLLGPLVAVYLWSGLVSMAVTSLCGAFAAGVPFASGLCVRVTEYLGQAMQAVVEIAAKVPGASIGVGPSLAVSLAAVCCLLIPGAAARRVRRRS